MYLTLSALVLITLFIISWFWHGFYVLLFVTIVYIGLIYLRADDITGYATYDWMRRLSLWRRISPVQILMGDEQAFVNGRAQTLVGQSRAHIFVVLPNATNTALLWAFGLHGNAWAGADTMRPCYIVPRSYFWLPVIRELMLASGAVSDRGKIAGQGLEDVVTDLLSRGRSVAYCPTGMADALSVHRTDVIETRQPCLALFRMALENSVRVVPVLCDGENDRRYIFVTNRWIRRVQAWFLERTGYPWPLIFFPDWSNTGDDEYDEYDDVEAQQGSYGSGNRCIDIQFGDALDPRDYQKHAEGAAEEMQRAFFRSVQQMSRETKEVVFKV